MSASLALTSVERYDTADGNFACSVAGKTFVRRED
jgi:hypothetical protein